MNKFSEWYHNHDTEITWWLLGWLTWGFLDTLARGSYGYAALNAILIAINYILWKKR